MVRPPVALANVGLRTSARSKPYNKPRASRAMSGPSDTTTTNNSTATISTPETSPFAPRHLLSVADLSAGEVDHIIDRAREIKGVVKHGHTGNPGYGMLSGQSVAMMFSKRSTRTRVSTEAAVAHFGGHAMFLGKDDIQLGVNESLYDTSRVISSMVSCMVARVNAHDDVAGLAKASTVPVINALSDMFHPLQALTDLMTIREAFPGRGSPTSSKTPLKLAWVGDANNVLYDLMLVCGKAGINVAACTPKTRPVDEDVLHLAREAADISKTVIETLSDPLQAVRDADIIVTDTWISMGQESEKEQKMREFDGYQVSSAMAQSGGAKEDWKFMHCLPRHQEEVTDEVFYSPRSLVFPEAENRKWIMIAVLEFLLKDH
ncbi:ornithine carbamoyltransferase [Savitreella phatthalungensis]